MGIVLLFLFITRKSISEGYLVIYLINLLRTLSVSLLMMVQRTRPVRFAMSLPRRISASASSMFQTAAYPVRGISALQERLGNTLPS